jgi:hypothetical protein
VKVVKARILRFTVAVVVALPVVLVMWSVVSLLTPGLGMHDGDL